MSSRLAEFLARDEVYFVAELGQNHQGRLDIAKAMVDSLAGTGVAAVKIAKRDIDVCLSDRQKSLPYEHPHSFGRTYYDHRRALELSPDDVLKLKRYAEQAGFDFISSFTDRGSLDFLVGLGVGCLKVASQRVTDTDLLMSAATTRLPVILSTGMSTLADVDRAVSIFRRSDTYLLQCTSTYPCPERDLNLRVIPMYQERYGTAIAGVGLSGHHVGIAPDLAAYMLGARVFERHYTLDRAMKGTDHAASLERRGIEYILKYLGQIREALGSSAKYLLPSEVPAMKKLRADLLTEDDGGV